MKNLHHYREEHCIIETRARAFHGARNLCHYIPSGGKISVFSVDENSRFGVLREAMERLLDINKAPSVNQHSLLMSDGEIAQSDTDASENRPTCILQSIRISISGALY